MKKEKIMHALGIVGIIAFTSIETITLLATYCKVCFPINGKLALYNYTDNSVIIRPINKFTGKPSKIFKFGAKEILVDSVDMTVNVMNEDNRWP